MQAVKPESMIVAVRMIVGSEARTLSGCMLGSISQPAGRQGIYMYKLQCAQVLQCKTSQWVKTWHVRCSGSSAHILSSLIVQYPCASLLELKSEGLHLKFDQPSEVTFSKMSQVSFLLLN